MLRRNLCWLLLLLGLPSSFAEVVVDATAAWRWTRNVVDPSPNLPSGWRELNFDDSGWSLGNQPFFYGEALEGTVLDDMFGNYTGIYLRRPFELKNVASISGARLRVLSDDGFIAWLNGKEIARFNVPEGELGPFATASGTFAEPLPTETYPIEDFRNLLVDGPNILAVQALNVSLAGSSDFVIQVVLETEQDDVPPTVLTTDPTPGSRVRELSRLTVTFSEGVLGVDAADLLINGIAATNLTVFGPDVYVFEFAPQPSGPVNVRWTANPGIRDTSPQANLLTPGEWTYTVDPNLPPPGVVLNEILADNDRTLNDEDGDASDWIELANTGTTSVNLGGWTLTDTRGVTNRWTFPPVTLPARGYLVVFASGKNRTNVLGRLHTNFRLGAAGGYVALHRPGGDLASEIADYPPQLEDVSYGRLPNDPLVTGFFVTPTPGAVNAEGGPNFSPEVQFSRIGGSLTEAFALTLSTTNAQAVIRYTTDGSVPGPTSPVYSAPLSIANSVRVRARSFVTGLLPGPVRAEYYVLLNPTAAAVTSPLPLVVIHSYGGGSVPPNGEYPAFLSIHEPRQGVASLTNAPDLRSRVRLNIRGSSTLGQAKRNFSIEFRDERDANRDVEPLGLPGESDWVLYAPNDFEPILIHNPFAYRLSESIGRYAPRTRFVEVYVVTGTGPLNATTAYQGVYVFTEKIKRDANRVNVDNLEPEHVREPEVTGGYVIKVDRIDPGDGGFYAAGQAMGFVDPKEEELNTAQRAPQRNYIQNYMDSFWNALYSANWRDPVRGWRAYVDEPSWIDHHLLNVLCFNVDALRLSAYFYKPRGGKLEFGPVWDFDRALNSTDGRDANPMIWRSPVSDLGTDFFNYTWWGRMFEDIDFWQRYIDRYQELRTSQFDTNRMFALIDDLVAQVQPAQAREAARWPGFTTPRVSYTNEVVSLKRWLGRRAFFMDTNFLARPSFSLAPGTVEAGTTVSLTGPAGATIYYTTDGSDPRARGGAVAGTARSYTGPIPITATTLLRVRARNLSHANKTGPNNPPISTPWSGVIEGRFATLAQPGPGEVELTEIHYHPPDPTPAELALNAAWTSDDFQFVELRHTAGGPIDLGAARFTAGFQFSFATSAIPVLEPGRYVVVVRNRDAFLARHGAALADRIAGVFTGTLSGSGESLRLEDDAGRVLAEGRYEDQWHPSTDGFGFSLVRTATAAQDGRDPRFDWRPSALPGGSPGEAEPLSPVTPPVVVNEIVSNPAAGDSDGFELFNPWPTAVDVSGWYVTDSRSEPTRYRLPPGSVLPSGALVWFDVEELVPGTANGSLGLGANGDALWIFAANAAGALTGYAHGFDFGASFSGEAFGRDVTCTGREILQLRRPVTKSAPNGPALESAVLITEFHAHPPDIVVGTDRWDDTALEFVEISNRGSTPVALFDAVRTNLTWQLQDAVAFAFPPQTTLAPGAVLVIANFDPLTNPSALARFRQTFSVPAGVPILGPFTGSLPNGAGRIELVMPGVPGTSGTIPWRRVDAVSYDDTRPWNAAADGTGRSWQRPTLDGLGDQPNAWVAALPTPGTLITSGDADGDGLPDAWEITHCLLPGDPLDATADPDGDRATNAQEYAARTNPRDPTDYLGWRSATIDDTGRLNLEFQAKGGLAYVIEVRSAFDASPWETWKTITAEGADRVIRESDLVGSGPHRFFRVRVVP